MVVNLVTKEVNRIPAVGSAFALSVNGNYVALIDNHRLELVRVATGEIERSTTLDSDTTVARMKWLNERTIWLASSFGIMLWKLDSPEEPEFLVEYDDSLEYTQVIDFHLSADGEWYLINYINDEIGKIQLGRVGGNYWSLMEGRAGDFVMANNCYSKDPLVSYFYREEDEKDKYYFKTDNLATTEEKYMDPCEMDWDDDLKGDYADYLVLNGKSCMGILTTHKGELQLWDIRKGLILCQSDLHFAAEVLVPLSTEGFVGIQRNSSTICRVTFDPEIALILTFKRRFSERLPLVVACRYGMHDLTSEMIQTLCQAMYFGDIITILDCLTTLGNAKRQSISKKFLTTHPLLINQVYQFIYNTWCIKEGINWEAEISWFFTKFKDEDVDTSPSPLPSKHRRTMEEQAAREEIEVWELKARYFAQSLTLNSQGFSVGTFLYNLIRDGGTDIDSSVVNLSLMIINEEYRDKVRSLITKLSEWEKSAEEEDSLEKLAKDLKENGLDEMSEEAHRRLVALFPDPVERGIQKVNLRHMLKGLGKETTRATILKDFIRNHVIVESLDVTELAIKLLDLEEDTRDEVMKEMVEEQFHDIYTKAKVKVLLRHEIARLVRWEPYIVLVEKMIEMGVSHESDIFGELLDELYEDVSQREEARRVVIEIMKTNKWIVCFYLKTIWRSRTGFPKSAPF